MAVVFLAGVFLAGAFFADAFFAADFFATFLAGFFTIFFPGAAAFLAILMGAASLTAAFFADAFFAETFFAGAFLPDTFFFEVVFFFAVPMGLLIYKNTQSTHYKRKTGKLIATVPYPSMQIDNLLNSLPIFQSRIKQLNDLPRGLANEGTICITHLFRLQISCQKNTISE
ncbi:MAG: hypothetical protein ABFR47_06135 [Verrucomicrobiota bacterium]